MRPSHRLSARLDEVSGDDLVDPRRSPIQRADDVHPAGVIYGRRQLALLRTRLSDRDLAVLQSLGALKYATSRQIERLHFRESHRTPLATSRAANRCLTRLYHLHLIDRLERRVGGTQAGSGSFVWLLAPAGKRLVGESDRRRSRDPSRVHLAHVLDVADLVVRLHEHARASIGAVELLAVETEPACWRQFVGHYGARVLLKPDLRTTLGIGEHELHWFIELDRGTEHRSALTRKINAYVAAWRDGGEEVRAGVFPRVLWVVPDDHRAEVIAEACATTNGVPEGMFAVSVTEQAVIVLTAPPAGGQT
jgi:hypothetical protein